MATNNPAPLATATIIVGGVRITAPVDLARMAGWTVCVDGTTRLRDEHAPRRLIRAFHETARDHPEIVVCDDENFVARYILGRVIELDEIEDAETRREQARREVAKHEFEAAALRLQAAELELRAAELRRRG